MDERGVLRAAEGLRRAFARSSGEGRDLARRLVPRLVRRLRSLGREERVLRAAVLWALAVAAELDALSGELMLRLGLPGHLVELLREEPAEAERHYADQLTRLLR